MTAEIQQFPPLNMPVSRPSITPEPAADQPTATATHIHKALREVDEDWNPAWPAEWQRHYAAVREMLAEESHSALAYVEPGVTVHGMDIGRWLARQRKHDVWQALMDGQRKRLAELGVEPLAKAPRPASAAGGGRAAAWERSLAAARAYLAREGTLTGVPRGHVEVVVHEGEPHAVKLGAWISNQRSRQASLPAERVEVLTSLGVI
ncbi:helicase associated domain-containing protein [Streptomyces natalensis]|uniref:helicase associated domain-containing protein n=1 Tax=Streptomyces natalensis TaxID=68242 RepID=UPI000AAA264B|nr:helicase associated domain-containing protein [Streptomyces natalensis]